MFKNINTKAIPAILFLIYYFTIGINKTIEPMYKLMILMFLLCISLFILFEKYKNNSIPKIRIIIFCFAIFISSIIAIYYSNKV